MNAFISLHDVKDVVIGGTEPGTAENVGPYVTRSLTFRMIDGSSLQITTYGFGDIPTRSAAEIVAEEGAALAASEEP